MPIFKKKGRRILFVHIPKTAGTSIYLAFAQAGYEIECLSANKQEGSAFTLLQQRCGVLAKENPKKLPLRPHLLSIQFAVETSLMLERFIRFGNRKRPRLTPIQHMPHGVWKRWGEFDDIFTIVRNPITRLESALGYHFRQTSPNLEYSDYRREIIRRASLRPWGHWSILGGHIIPQHYFISKQTRIHKFENDWKAEICSRYDLDLDTFPEANVSPMKKDTSDCDLRSWAVRRYRSDFDKLGYVKD